MPNMTLPESEASSLLKSVFEYLDEAGIEYCVERNYEGYPERLTGDVDLVVGDRDLIGAASGIISVAAKSGWNCYQHHVWEKTAYIGLAADVFPNRFALTIELFAGARWHGLPFLGAAPILKNRSSHGVTWRPRPAHQVVITAIHHLLYNNHIPEKYREELSDLASSDSDEIESSLMVGFGKSWATKIRREIVASNWLFFDAELSRRLKVAVILRSFITNPIGFFRVTVMGILANSRRPEGVIVYVGLANRLFAERFCDSLLEICHRWHIFAPPLRYVIDRRVRDGRDFDLLKKAMSNGGVAIITKPALLKKAQSIASLPIYEIEGEDKEILIKCNGIQIANYHEFKGVSVNAIERHAHQVLNDILAHRTISYGPYLNEK